MKVAEDAAKKAQEQAAAQQAGQPMDPTAQGMAAPAAAQSLTGSPIPGASPGQADLAGLLSTLRKPAMTITPMKGVARGAV